MRVSELVVELQALLQKHGDLEVFGTVDYAYVRSAFFNSGADDDDRPRIWLSEYEDDPAMEGDAQ